MKLHTLSMLLLAAFVAMPVMAEPIGADGKADGSFFAAATLAPLNSFEWEAAPSYTRLASLRRTAAVNLRKGRITIEQAEIVQATADKARVLLDASLSACAQNNRTGKCTGSSKRAQALLAQARAVIATIKVQP